MQRIVDYGNDAIRSIIMDNENTINQSYDNQYEPIDFSNTQYLKKIEPLLLIQEEWKRASEELLGGGIEYTDGQKHIINILKHLLDLQLPFEETVKQLTNIVKERETFISFAYENAP